MPFWADHALFVALAALFPLRASLFGFRRLRMAEPSDVPRVRRSLYRQAIALQWTLAGVTLGLWIVRGRPWSALGLVPHFHAIALTVVAVMAAAVAYIAHQRRRTLASDESLARVRHQLRHVERLLPRTAGELRGFLALAATAGICEELLYRGYVIWYLQPWVGTVPAIGLAAVVFGFGHLYQGARGVLTTAIGMVLHALTDAHSGQLAYEAWRREEAVAAPDPGGPEPLTAP
jgi:CAAX protease family protein